MSISRQTIFNTSQESQQGSEHTSSTPWSQATNLIRVALVCTLFLGFAVRPSQDVSAAYAKAPAHQTGQMECIEFDRIVSPPGGPTYHLPVGSTFKEASAKVAVEDFFDGASWITYGNTFVDTNTGPGGQNGAGGSGYEANVAKSSISVHYPRTFKNMEFYFGEYGGVLNIDINGDFRFFKDFADINGANIGGVDVKVINGHGQDMGQVYLLGQIKSFKVGGEELWLDHICPEFDQYPKTPTPTPTQTTPPTRTPTPTSPTATPTRATPTPPVTATSIPTVTLPTPTSAP